MAEDNLTYWDRIKDDPWILLDTTDIVEQLPFGPDENERNESRLNSLITGESRPMSHKTKEGASWIVSNVGVPLVTAGLTKAAKTARLAKMADKGGDVIQAGVKAAKAKKGVDAGLKGASRELKRATADITKKADKALSTAMDIFKKEGSGLVRNEVKGDTPGLVGELFHIKSGKGPLSNEKLAISNYKETARAINDALKMADGKGLWKTVKTISDDPETQMSIMSSLQALLASGIEISTDNIADVIANGYEPTKIPEEERSNYYDPRVEMGFWDKTWHNVKSFFDLNNLESSKYNMDKVNRILEKFNSETSLLDRKQLEQLDDEEKIKLIKDVAKGKYNDFEDLSSELRRVYKEINERDEE